MQDDLIKIDPDVMGGKPVIRGTRIPVDLILRKLTAGMSPDVILADLPRLELKDIHAVRKSHSR